MLSLLVLSLLVPGPFALTCTAGHTLCGPCGGFHTVQQAARPRRPLRCLTSVAVRRARQGPTLSGPLPPPPPPGPPPRAGDAQGNMGASLVRSSPAPTVRGSGASAGAHALAWRGGRRRPGASRTASCRGPRPQELRGRAINMVFFVAAVKPSRYAPLPVQDPRSPAPSSRGGLSSRTSSVRRR